MTTKRRPATLSPNVQVDVPLSLNPPNGKRRFTLNTAKTRLEAYQRRWEVINSKLLPPQIKRRHISAISIGGVIGTGLFLGTATAIRHAGPIGTILGYTITSSVVWAVVVSIGEIVSFLPNVGGPVGLAGLYVDPALGFAMGWMAWYNWTIILPTELSAAALLINGFFDQRTVDLRTANLISISILSVLVVAINCFGSRGYGEAEFLFSCVKIITIVALIIIGIVLDLREGPNGRIGLRNWLSPSPFVAYRAEGRLGEFLGVWSSINQAVFAFFGTEIAGVSAGEVQNPTRNVPLAMRRVWIRIVLFYVLGVAVAGLLVRSDDPRLFRQQTGNAGKDMVSLSPFVIALRDSGWKHIDKAANAAFVLSAFSASVSDVYISSRFLFFLSYCHHAPRFCATTFSVNSRTVVPWVGILLTLMFATLAFMSASSAEDAFHWLSSMNTVTALLGWIGMLWTYLRWHKGTKYQERRDHDFRKRNWEYLYANRTRGQPWIAIYAFVMCILVLVFNGWFVFTRPGPWRIATEPSDVPPTLDPDIGGWVPTFVSSYLPLPLFFLLLLGYKLIYRTRMVRVHEMSFNRGNAPEVEDYTPSNLWEKILYFLF